MEQKLGIGILRRQETWQRRLVRVRNLVGMQLQELFG
jgi:hypothetical protein